MTFKFICSIIFIIWDVNLTESRKLQVCLNTLNNFKMKLPSEDSSDTIQINKVNKWKRENKNNKKLCYDELKNSRIANRWKLKPSFWEIEIPQNTVNTPWAYIGTKSNFDGPIFGGLYERGWGWRRGRRVLYLRGKIL